MKKDCVWTVVKHPQDSARYAICSCGFEYKCVIDLKPIKTTDDLIFYNYCPNCGRRKYEFLLW